MGTFKIVNLSTASDATCVNAVAILIHGDESLSVLQERFSRAYTAEITVKEHQDYTEYKFTDKEGQADAE